MIEQKGNLVSEEHRPSKVIGEITINVLPK